MADFRTLPLRRRLPRAKRMKRPSADANTTPRMDQISVIQMLMMSSPLRRRAFELVAALRLPDCWIGAGFVRDAVWDHLHGYDAAEPFGDVDVIWHHRASPHADLDRQFERKLHEALPGQQWSVKNQARMHLRNGDAPYTSVADAMQHWPETATAVAARLGDSGSIEVNAPLGLDDLFALRLRPTPAFQTEKLPIFTDRVSSKRWTERYPNLSLDAAASSPT